MSIETMKQALEALEKDSPWREETITSLRQAIAEAEKQEPVAWGVPNTRITERQPFMMLLHSTEGCQYPEMLVPLYTTPQPQQAEKQEPVAWITHESKWRLTGGGNANGTVPVHAKQSNTAKYPLYTILQPQEKNT